MTAAQKAVAKNLATHDGTMTFFRPTAKAAAGQQKVPKKLKGIESGTSFSSIFNPIAANYSSYFGFGHMGMSSTAAAQSSALNSIQYNSADDDIVRSFST